MGSLPDQIINITKVTFQSVYQYVVTWKGSARKLNKTLKYIEEFELHNQFIQFGRFHTGCILRSGNISPWSDESTTYSMQSILLKSTCFGSPLLFY